jgi:hypothetical protein
LIVLSGWCPPLTCRVPASCSVLPTMDWSSVDFPPATGPLISTSSPCSICRSTSPMLGEGAGHSASFGSGSASRSLSVTQPSVLPSAVLTRDVSPCRKRLFCSQLFLCVSRACLGKTISCLLLLNQRLQKVRFPHLAARFPLFGVLASHDLLPDLQKTSLVSNFPDVCPEPVLANIFGFFRFKWHPRKKRDAVFPAPAVASPRLIRPPCRPCHPSP